MRWLLLVVVALLVLPAAGARAGRQAADEVAGLRGAARLAAALAAERDAG